MNLKWAMLKAFEFAIDNEKKEYEDIYVFSDELGISFSIFDKKYDYQKLKEYYDDISLVSFGVYITKKKVI